MNEHWISIEESLPRILEKVLFFWITDAVFKNISMGFMDNRGWNIYLPYHSYVLNSDYVQVTHWMHLPKYPKYSNEKIKAEHTHENPVSCA